jgi:uncharacterized membrane protein
MTTFFLPGISTLVLVWLVFLAPLEGFVVSASLQPATTFLASTRTRGRPKTLSSTASDEDEQPPKSNEFAVSADIELPFSSQIAYDAFVDLPRQPQWSPWLHSVEYVDDTLQQETRWKMRYMGVRVTWIAISTRNERPIRIEWESIKGLRNKGRVDFVENGNVTYMKLTMTFTAPRFAVGLFRRTGAIQKVVEKKMLQTTLENFRDVVLMELMEIDVKQGNQGSVLHEVEKI